jgi:hypothetical protein
LYNTPINCDYAVDCAPRLAAPSLQSSPISSALKLIAIRLQELQKGRIYLPLRAFYSNRKSSQKRSCPVSCNPDQTNLTELDMLVPIF